MPQTHVSCWYCESTCFDISFVWKLMHLTLHASLVLYRLRMHTNHDINMQHYIIVIQLASVKLLAGLIRHEQYTVKGMLSHMFACVDSYLLGVKYSTVRPRIPALTSTARSMPACSPGRRVLQFHTSLHWYSQFTIWAASGWRGYRIGACAALSYHLLMGRRHYILTRVAPKLKNGPYTHMYGNKSPYRRK